MKTHLEYKRQKATVSRIFADHLLSPLIKGGYYGADDCIGARGKRFAGGIGFAPDLVCLTPHDKTPLGATQMCGYSNLPYTNCLQFRVEEKQHKMSAGTETAWQQHSRNFWTSECSFTIIIAVVVVVIIKTVYIGYFLTWQQSQWDLQKHIIDIKSKEEDVVILWNEMPMDTQSCPFILMLFFFHSSSFQTFS